MRHEERGKMPDVAGVVMSEALSQLEPRSLWGHFAELCAIPRPSKHEEKAVEWAVGVAEAHGFAWARDGAGNLVIDVPASPGRDAAPVVVLQGHLDMVAEKDGETAHDFLRDPIRARVDGDWVRAEGTTLGADNGIGVAAALAAATDAGVPHGPLQLLLTIDEETGLTGAAGLDGSRIRGRTLLNLDSEEDGILYIGCAGGADSILTGEPTWVAPTVGSRAYLVSIRGLRGGHSGMDIRQNRGNAVKSLVRLLVAGLDDGIALELADLRGGSKHNALPREADVLLFLGDGDAERFRSIVGRMVGVFRKEQRGVDEGVEVRMEPSQHDGRVLERTQRNRLLQLLLVLPHGVLALSPESPDLVETSSNLAAIDTTEDGIRIACSSRSSVESALDHVLTSIRAAAAMAGFECTMQDRYPGWEPDWRSPVLDVAKRVYAELLGREPEVTAVHAGLECGLLGRRVKGLDMVSFGPDIVGAHSPEERVRIASVSRFWRALTRVLDELSRPAPGMSGV